MRVEGHTRGEQGGPILGQRLEKARQYPCCYYSGFNMVLGTQTTPLYLSRQTNQQM